MLQKNESSSFLINLDLKPCRVIWDYQPFPGLTQNRIQEVIPTRPDLTTALHVKFLVKHSGRCAAI